MEALKRRYIIKNGKYITKIRLLKEIKKAQKYSNINKKERFL